MVNALRLKQATFGHDSESDTVVYDIARISYESPSLLFYP